ncbi:TetR family transcriptional regulator [Streptomyces sp. NPDC057433]|uniref:TetR family transcriptional regulator n=1 Tax=Streptomyces sp. NPDC057433 TaxID=3346132 RepID=UPI0036AD9493
METIGTVVGAVPSPAPATGLRERKKRLTRDALVRASLELFAARGYEGTTVDDITAAVHVSQRTFFRYFASKEEVAFHVPHLAESLLVDAVQGRPPGEPPLDALRGALRESWDGVNQAVEQVVPLELHLRVYRVIESTPALLAAHLRRSSELEERLARVIADREGVDLDTDPRPRVLVAAVCSVIRVAERSWSAGDDTGLTALRELTTTHLDQLGPALAGSWGGT